MTAPFDYKYLTMFVVLVVLLGLVRSQPSCNEISTCLDCIRNVNCAWCYDPSYPLDLPRCILTDSSLMDFCTPQFLENPINNISTVPLELQGTNQVSLESVNLQLKEGTSETFTVSVREAENFPLDLYLLMDLSGRFELDLRTVQGFAPSLFSNLSEVTPHFRVGVGAFVDKPTPPYSSLSQIRNLVRPFGACAFLNVAGAICSPPFSFEHLVAFTDDQNVFSNGINNINISASVDDPQGTLDAMLQATVCTDVIGWSEHSRKVLLVFTSSPMHMAGDGSLAGINRPNDAVCRTSFDPTTGRTLYNASLEYDYPSIEQVRLALEEFDIVPVVVFGTQTSPDYSVVNSAIAAEFNAIAANLESQPANLVLAIRDVYDQNINSARLTYDEPSFLSVKVIPSCPAGSIQLESACVGIGNNTVNFTVTITLNECTEEVMNEIPYSLEINVEGFDRFTVNIQGICSCECARPELVDINSTLCAGRGAFVCSVCECLEPYIGETCDCDPTQMCPAVNEFECAGPTRGVCNGCGVCECRERFVGPACECSNFGCDCSGRGSCTSCINGTEICDCTDSFFGANCECTYDVCIYPGSPFGELCSGNGMCNPCPPQAGCVCNSQMHAGTFCQLEV